MLNRTFGDLGTQHYERLMWEEESSVQLVWNRDDAEVDQKHTIFSSSLMCMANGFTETINGSFFIPTIFMLSADFLDLATQLITL